MPYSSTVNVGTLIRAVNQPISGDSVQYRRRVGVYDDYDEDRVINSTNVVQTYSASISQTACNQYAANAGYPTLDGQPATTGGPPPAPETTVSYSLKDWGQTGDTSGTSRTCRRNKRTEVTQTGWFADGSWSFTQDWVDTSVYKTGANVTIADHDDVEADGAAGTSGNYDPRQSAAVVNGVNTETVHWDGCIEERQTVNTITSASGYTVPSGANDLNINMIPNNTCDPVATDDAVVIWRRNWTARDHHGRRLSGGLKRLQA